MILIKDIEKYDNVIENCKDTLGFLLHELCYNPTSDELHTYLKIFNMLCGTDFKYSDIRKLCGCETYTDEGNTREDLESEVK